MYGGSYTKLSLFLQSEDMIKFVESNREQLMFTDVHVRGHYPRHTLKLWERKKL